MIIVLIHIGYVSIIPFGESKTVSICKKEFKRHPAFITKVEDKDIWMNGHYLDHGGLSDFIGPDHKVHANDIDLSPLMQQKEYLVRASYVFSFL